MREFRKNKGMSQEELADLLNISQSTCQRIENGETNSWAIHIQKLSEVLETTPEELISDENPSFSNEGQRGGMAFQYIGTINTVNTLSEKLIEQYERRIDELNKRILELEK
ncbi:MAG: helix-turn-helix domain-containing protein [Moheibacter sp.]